MITLAIMRAELDKREGRYDGIHCFVDDVQMDPDAPVVLDIERGVVRVYREPEPLHQSVMGWCRAIDRAVVLKQHLVPDVLAMLSGRHQGEPFWCFPLIYKAGVFVVYNNEEGHLLRWMKECLLPPRVAP